jgi:transcriptional regulator with XRE-family HTH domain
MVNVESQGRKTLKQLRLEKGYSQTTLADAVGVAQSVIGRYEARQNLPRVDHFFKLAKVLDVPTETLGEFFGLETEGLPSQKDSTGTECFDKKNPQNLIETPQNLIETPQNLIETLKPLIADLVQEAIREAVQNPSDDTVEIEKTSDSLPCLNTYWVKGRNGKKYEYYRLSYYKDGKIKHKHLSREQAIAHISKGHE